MAFFLDSFKKALLARAHSRGSQELLNVLTQRVSPESVGEKMAGGYQELTFAQSAAAAFQEAVAQKDPALNILKVRSKRERGQAPTSGEFFGEIVQEPGFLEKLGQTLIGKSKVKEAREGGRIDLFNLVMGDREIQSVEDVRVLERVRESLLEQKDIENFNRSVSAFERRRKEAERLADII